MTIMMLSEKLNKLFSLKCDYLTSDTLPEAQHSLDKYQSKMNIARFESDAYQLWFVFSIVLEAR